MPKFNLSKEEGLVIENLQLKIDRSEQEKQIYTSQQSAFLKDLCKKFSQKPEDLIGITPDGCLEFKEPEKKGKQAKAKVLPISPK